MALPTINGVSFCTGIGGIELGLKSELGDRYRTVCYVEGEAYACGVLAARIKEGQLCDAPIWSDVRSFDAGPWRGLVDLISAGYPCQPFSAAGKQRGTEDPRHLWPHILRHVATIKPSIVFCENVFGHVALGFEQVVRDLCSLGYRVQAGIYSASERGARHERKRLYFIGYLDGAAVMAYSRCESGRTCEDGRGDLACEGGRVSSGRNESHGIACDSGEALAHADDLRELQSQGRVSIKQRRLDHCNMAGVAGWSVEPNLGRVADGVPARVDRLRALGNAVVPEVARFAFADLCRQALAS